MMRLLSAMPVRSRCRGVLGKSKRGSDVPFFGASLGVQAFNWAAMPHYSLLAFAFVADPRYWYQDAAATIPVTSISEVIGAWKDLKSNTYATQSTTAKKPSSDKVSNRWQANFNGNNALAATFASAFSQPFKIITMGERLSPVGSAYRHDGIGPDPVRMAMLGSGGGSGTTWGLHAGTTLTHANEPAVNGYYVSIADFNGASSKLILNGSTLEGNAGTGSLSGITIGNRYSQDFGFTKRITFQIGGVLSDVEAAAIATWAVANLGAVN